MSAESYTDTLGRWGSWIATNAKSAGTSFYNYLDLTGERTLGNRIEVIRRALYIFFDEVERDYPIHTPAGQKRIYTLLKEGDFRKIWGKIPEDSKKRNRFEEPDFKMIAFFTQKMFWKAITTNEHPQRLMEGLIECCFNPPKLSVWNNWIPQITEPKSPQELVEDFIEKYHPLKYYLDEFTLRLGALHNVCEDRILLNSLTPERSKKVEIWAHYERLEENYYFSIETLRHNNDQFEYGMTITRVKDQLGRVCLFVNKLFGTADAEVFELYYPLKLLSELVLNDRDPNCYVRFTSDSYKVHIPTSKIAYKLGFRPPGVGNILLDEKPLGWELTKELAEKYKDTSVSLLPQFHQKVLD